jgi:hypothetical protein
MLFKNCFYIRSDEGNNIEVLLAITKNYLLTSQVCFYNKIEYIRVAD